MRTESRVLLDHVRWHQDTSADDGIPTCMLHSYTKAALTALSAQEKDIDPVWITGASGAAFRIWVHKDLCPSATSMFDWSLLPSGLRNSGWDCEYHSRLWHEESVAEERRGAAHTAIVKALQDGRVPICWDIDVPEWGVITGYDDEVREYSAISVFGEPARLKYDQLGRREVPIMSVTMIHGPSDANRRESLLNSLWIAVRHAEQGEWQNRPDYQDGLPAYEAWARALERLAEGGEQNMLSYYAGTYLAARHYAKRYLDLAADMLDGDERLEEATRAYGEVEAHLKEVWAILSKDGRRTPEELRKTADSLRAARASEEMAVQQIRAYLHG